MGAGVTKGGLFHHFPNKQSLIFAVFDNELSRLDLLIEDLLAHDSKSYGCFTRAYIRAIFVLFIAGDSVLTFSLCAEPELVSRWYNWLAQRLEMHCSTDNSPALKAARLAADGLWFNQLLKGEKIEKSENTTELQQQLLAMTKEPDE